MAEKGKNPERATRKVGKKVRLTPVTLAEFRAWLGGVEEMQPAGWIPNAEQWKLIRDKIDMIKEPEPVVRHVEVPAQRQAATFQERPITAESAFSQPLMPAVTPPATLLPGPDGKFKTPDIDTSHGSFKSLFE